MNIYLYSYEQHLVVSWTVLYLTPVPPGIKYLLHVKCRGSPAAEERFYPTESYTCLKTFLSNYKNVQVFSGMNFFID